MGRTCSPTLVTLRPALLPAVSSKGKGIFLSSHMPSHSRQWCGRSALLLSCLQGWLICVTSNRVRSSVLPRIAAGIAEGWSHPSWVQGCGGDQFSPEDQGQHCCSSIQTWTRPPILERTKNRASEKQGQLSTSSRLQHTWFLWPQVVTWTMNINTDPSYRRRTTNPNMSLGNSSHPKITLSWCNPVHRDEYGPGGSMVLWHLYGSKW